MKTKTFLVLIPFIFIVISGCKKSSEDLTSPGLNEVWMKNLAFTPASITVSVNTTVKWINKDNVAHNVKSSTGLFDSGTLNGAGTYSYQFTTAGTYTYTCTLHSNMNGTVIVN